MKFTSVFLIAGSFLLKGSAMDLTIEHLYPSARMLHGVNVHRRDVPANATFDAVIGATRSAIGQQAIQNDILSLTTTTLSIIKSFNSIAAQLAVIDGQNLTTTTFSGQWKLLQQQFLSHLSDSRSAATNISAFCQELSGTIAPFVLNAIPGQTPIPPATATTILEQAIAEAQGLQSTALLVSQGFGTLVTNMVNFTSTFAAFADKEQSINAQLSQLRIDLDIINIQIDGLRGQIADLSLQMDIVLFGGAALSAFFPIFAPVIMGAAAATIIGDKSQLQSLRDQLSNAQLNATSIQAKISLLTAELQQISQANSTLSNITDSTIPTMAFQLNTFEEIWNAVNSDLTALILFVNTAKNIPLLAYEILKTQVSPLYMALSNAMLAYASGIQSVGATSNFVELPATVANHAPLTQTAAKIQAILAKSSVATS